jgi:hypothetical protein
LRVGQRARYWRRSLWLRRVSRPCGDEHYRDAQDTSLLQLTYTYDKAGNRLTKKYDNDGSRVENYTVNGYNQLEAVSGKTRAYTNVTGLLDEANIDTVTVTNASLTQNAARVDLLHGFFIGRKLPIQDGDNNIEFWGHHT